MKKWYLFFILVLALLLCSCDGIVNNNKNNDEPKNEEPQDEPVIKEESSIVLNTNDINLALNATYNLDVVKTGSLDYEYRYDENVIRVYDDVIIPNNVGRTSLELVVDGKVEKTIYITVYEKPLELKFIDLPSVIIINEVVGIKTNNEDVILSISSDNCILDLENMTLKGASIGKTTITATYKYDESLSVSKTVEVKNAIEKADFVLVDSDIDAKKNDIIETRGYEFIFGVNLFNTIEDAMDYADVIYIGKTLEESLTISSSNVTLDGRMLDGALDLLITISSGVHDVSIINFTFTAESKIVLVSGNSNILIENNIFKDTKKASSSWVETNKYISGVIELSNATNYHDNIVIKNNTFNNIGDTGINVSTTHNITIENNKFMEFARDAVRFNNGIIKEECTWSINNNTFIDGEYNGVFFRTYGTDTSDIFHYVDVKGNYFDSLGKAGGEFVGAVTFRNYQEGCACVWIAYNTFSGGSKYIFLRNNATSAHQVNFYGYVEGNIFNDVPSSYYFNNLNSSDTFSTNPKQTKLINNAYLNNGKDITPDNKLFIGNYNNVIMKSEKVKSLYRFDLHHVLYVGKEVKLTDDVTAVDSDKFTIAPLSIKPLDNGVYVLKHDDQEFEVVCIIKLELVVKFINIALGEVGYQEMDANGNTGTSGNYTKYGAWYGINPGAWCAMFVSWCANQAGVSTSIIPKYASVQIGMDWYKNKGLFKYKEEYTPKAGDIMFMKSNNASHTGIVLYCDGKTLYTVEGNTSDCCACRKYDVNNAKITGYGTPEWPYYSPDGYNFSDGRAQDGSGHSTT